jgi:dienelactone hydrolase
VAAVAAIAAASASAGATAERPFPHFAGGCGRADFVSAGAHIRAERCGPAHGRRAVIVLHGCGGFSTFDHEIAADLPRYGISTLYVDYFGPTPPLGDKGFCNGGGRGEDPFPIWEQVARDAARSLRPHFARVGAVGWSLGAGVAIAAAENYRPFDAIASFSGVAGHTSLDRTRNLPPTIFLSGGSHDIVPTADVRAMYAATKHEHVVTSLFVYPNGTHNWPGHQGDVGRAKAAAFLLRYL